MKRRAQAGFTLIETLIAMMIMSGAVMVLAMSWSGNVARIKSSRTNNTMALLLERKMTEKEIEFRSKPHNEIPEEENGDFGPKYPGYRWEVKSQDFEMPNLSGALISKEGGADENLLMIVQTMTDHIRETVKEVSVFVYYKAHSSKEIKSNVTTYFVDYSKPIPIPGMPSGAGSGNETGSGTGSGAGSATGGGQ